jgi:hypothetical protein
MFYSKKTTWADVEISDQELKIIFNDLLERGKELQHEIRHGTLRKPDGYYNYFSDPAKLLGIHPEEAALLERKEKAEFIGLEKKPMYYLKANLVETPATEKDKQAALKELKKIDYEWCVLNNRLLDEYYFEDVKDVSRNDFVLTFHPPKDDMRFPNCAGQWLAKSKLWGIKLFDGHISPLYASAPSKNQSLFLALNKIQSRKEKQKDLVQVPFDPWDVDL